MKIKELIWNALHKDALELLSDEQEGKIVYGRPDWTLGTMRFPQSQRAACYVLKALCDNLPAGQFSLEEVRYPDDAGGEVICSWYEEDSIHVERWEYIFVWFKEDNDA